MRLREQVHSPNVKTILRLYPASIGSKNWPEIMRLADKDLEAAKSLAGAGEVFKQIRARNIIGRLMRVQRVALFARLAQAEKEMREWFSSQSKILYEFILKNADSTGKINRINMRVRLWGIETRAVLKKIIYDLIKDSAKMGFKHAGDALLPIFKANRESFKAIEPLIPAERILYEAQLSFSLSKKIASKDPRVKTTSDYWKTKKDRVVKNIAKKNLAGQTFSERVVDLSMRAEMDMRRTIANGIAAGRSPMNIANDIRKYVAPYNHEVDASPGPGVYKNPFRNAMRIARTETNRAYGMASAQFAKGKAWIKGIQITLSPAHEDEDVCDDWAGKVVSPEEFEELVPFHPHCMCYSTYVIDDDYLEGEE